MKSITKDTENDFKYFDLDDNLNVSVTTGKTEIKSKHTTTDANNNINKDAQMPKNFIETNNLLKDPRLLRRKANNDYEPPVSDRESWWRCTIKETPSPLKYKMNSFLNEALKKPNTYRFKSDGRRHNPTPQIGKGEYLLPGAYSYEDFGQRVKKINLTYGFKNETLEKAKSRIVPNSNPDLGPFTYETENYLTVSLPYSERIRHSFFKSQQKRNVFPPKSGPSPGEYSHSVLEREKQIEITSVFKSDSDRFHAASANKLITPGPGAYEPISAWINSKQSQEFNSKGVFFPTSSKVIY